MNGTEKQIAWATDIRNELVDTYTKALEYIGNESGRRGSIGRNPSDAAIAEHEEDTRVRREALTAAIEALNSIDDAKTLIDNRRRMGRLLGKLGVNMTDVDEAVSFARFAGMPVR